jgi:hypothetical protein
LVAPLILYLLLALTGRLGCGQALTAAWAVGIFALSQVLQGYAVYPPAISFSRTLITVPVLVTAGFLAAEALPRSIAVRHLAGRLPERYRTITRTGLPVLLSLLIVLNLGIGLANLYRPFVQGDAAKYFSPGPLQPIRLLVSDINRQADRVGLTEADAFDLIVYADSIWLQNLRDYTQYFFPDAQVRMLADGAELPVDIGLDRPALIYVIGQAAADTRLSSWPDREVRTLPAGTGLDVTYLYIRPGQFIQ